MLNTSNAVSPNKRKCRPVQQENMYFCSTRTCFLCFNTRTPPNFGPILVTLYKLGVNFLLISRQLHTSLVPLAQTSYQLRTTIRPINYIQDIHMYMIIYMLQYFPENTCRCWAQQKSHRYADPNQVPGTIRYLARPGRSGTWHDLVPGTTWQIRYLARSDLVPGTQIWYLARSDNYLID